MKTWDIFCRVIDNFGDIGVCWRLARQLAAEHQQPVRLWVDDLTSLKRIWPDTQMVEQQQLAGVEVRSWHVELDVSTQPANIVIEAFACDIPDSYLKTMAQLKASGQAPVWINLEYLSAEPWVAECHGMASVHPTTGLRKTFFFPGFSALTGGLLREQNLLAQRAGFNKQDWLAQLDIHPSAESLLISLFGYENPAVGELLATWEQSAQPIHCLVPEGKILASINATLGKTLGYGDSYRSGNLTLEVIPFITQTEYDKLLWACDINFVRGEDSFVRAQWAAKPMVWHIYTQDENAHLIKLDAFLKAYTQGQNQALADAIRQFWQDWNENGDSYNSWNQLLGRLAEWQKHCNDWSQTLAQQPDLAGQLVDYCLRQQP